MVLTTVQDNKTRLRWRDDTVGDRPVAQSRPQHKAKQFSKDIRDGDATVVAGVLPITDALVQRCHRRLSKLRAVRDRAVSHNSIEDRCKRLAYTGSILMSIAQQLRARPTQGLRKQTIGTCRFGRPEPWLVLWGLHVCVAVDVFVDMISKQGTQYTARETLVTPGIAMGREQHGIDFLPLHQGNERSHRRWVRGRDTATILFSDSCSPLRPAPQQSSKELAERAVLLSAGATTLVVYFERLRKLRLQKAVELARVPENEMRQHVGRRLILCTVQGTELTRRLLGEQLRLVQLRLQSLASSSKILT